MRTLTVSKLKEVESRIIDAESKLDVLRNDKRALEAKLLLPKIKEKYLGKYFLKKDGKEEMLIHIRELLSTYEYKGVKVMISSNGCVEVNPNYHGHISSLSNKEVSKSYWDSVVENSINILEKI